MAKYIYDRLYIDELNQYADNFSDSYLLFNSVNQHFANSKINYVDNKINILTENQLTPEEEETLDSIVNDVNSNAYNNILKHLKQSIIDTVRLENNLTLEKMGVEFPPSSGIKYSMTHEDITIWNGMMLASSNLQYPVKIRDVNNISHYFNNATEIQQFWGAGLQYMQWIFDSTVEKINEINALTTITDVLNWTDDRLS